MLPTKRLVVNNAILKRNDTPLWLIEHMKNELSSYSSAMTYTDKYPPPIVDELQDIHKMMDEFNNNYKQNYIPIWTKEWGYG